MSICCKAIRQIYYNAGSGYTVASYMTNEDLPEEVKKQKNGNYGIFQAFGTELPTNEGLDVELTGDWKPTKYGMQYSVRNFSVTMPTTKEGIYSDRWDVNERTKERIPSLPEDYLVSKEAEEILQMVDKTPARLFMLTGDARTGKTTDARMIAQILGLPYYVFTCGPGTDELELLATTVPNMGGTAHLEMELPRLEDIEMDPASALATVNGIYEEGISLEKAFQEILKAVYEKGYEKSKNEKDFLLKESEIVKACREPSVIEIQEPAMIEKPGTLTRLNSLFDDGAVTDLVNGEQIRRNPDTIVIMTTNLDYVGCQNFNQSVLSRMNLIQPKEALTEEEMAKRAMKRTGFKNKELLSFMAATVCKIHEYLIEQDITDGVCGYRELENWVLSYMVSNDLRRSAWTALLSKASMDREEQGTMERVFLLPHCDVD